MQQLPTLISQKTALPIDIVTSIISLIQEGNTIPFIARYRKEMTGGASDTQLRDFEEIYTYQLKLAEKKEDILRLLTEKEVLTPELEKAIHKADTLSQLDDIYRPFKDKKNTRATKAIAKWLQPLADTLLACEMTWDEFTVYAQKFVKETLDEKTTVSDIHEAVQWAKDIVAEIIADAPELRNHIRQSQSNTISLKTAPTKTFDEKSVYGIYKDYTKSLTSIPNYAYLAICRAEKEKQLRVKTLFNETKSNAEAKRLFIPAHATNLKILLIEAIEDGIKRLLHPSLERELRSAKKETSDREAIDIFGKNVEELLLSSPVKNKVIMWFDPAYRTGCKIAVVNKTWSYLESTVVYPTEPQKKTKEAEQILLWLIKKHNIWLICIGNGTASRESETFVAQMIKKNNLSTKYLVVSEAWASVYSASKLANEEYPDLDVTIRGAINIAQRVQDPLATYVKIDPKSLWVGQYQHDVDQKLLKEKLEHHIEDAVNRVGIDINTASRALLQHIAGLSTKTAQHIVSHREENGVFLSRSQFKKVKWLGPKAFEQCAGFLRIRAMNNASSTKEPLDQTGIHPESYKVTYEILEKECGIKKKKLKLPFQFPSEKNIRELADTYEIWEQTLIDIIAELANPWLDPREAFDDAGFKSDVLTIEDLTKGMKLQWVVRNITDFWAFIDVWLKNDGLVHKSQIADRYVSNVFDVVSIWQQVQVTVVDIDLERKRVGLSMKSEWGTKPAVSRTVRRSPMNANRSTERKEVVEWGGGKIKWK